MTGDPITNAFLELQIELPSDEHICVYRTGLLDSVGLMQLLLEIELETGKRLNMAALMEGEITLSRIRAAIEASI